MRKHHSGQPAAIDMSQFNIILEQLATQAGLENLIDAGGPSLPSGWVLLALIDVSVPIVLPVQGFLASGPADNTGTQVAVLAMGLKWSSYMYGQVDGTMIQGSIPVEIGGTAMPVGSEFLSVFVAAYKAARADTWKTLQFLGSLPLYVCGISLGGPLAQLAALDLRPGNTGPGGQDAPSVSSPCIVFSTADAGNQTLATYYRSVVTCTNMWAGNAILQVDQFPTSPSDGASFVPLGSVQNLLGYLPNMNEPWLERSDIYYLDALGGSPAIISPVPVSVSSPPAGFSQSTAFTMAMLTAAAYGQAQQPGSICNTDPYSLFGIIYSLGVPYAYVFQSSDTVVVTFNGCITYADFNNITCNSNFATPSFAPSGNVHVHAGAYSVYSSPVVNGSRVTFAQSLQQTLLSINSGKKVCLAGHDLGGALANFAAADYALNVPSLVVSAIYTFGGILPGDFAFSQSFNGKVTAASYQVVRTADKLYNAIQKLGYSPVNNQVTLNGNLSIDESTFHSLYGYAGLLNPAGPANWQPF